MPLNPAFFGGERDAMVSVKNFDFGKLSKYVKYNYGKMYIF